MNLSSLALWNDFTAQLISFGDVHLPKALTTLHFVPVNALINEVTQAHDLQVKQRYNYAAFIATAAILVIIIACLSLYLYCRCRKQKVYTKLLQSWFKFRKSADKGEPELKVMGTAPSSPYSEFPAFVAGPLESTDKATDQRGYMALYPNVKYIGTRRLSLTQFKKSNRILKS